MPALPLKMGADRLGAAWAVEVLEVRQGLERVRERGQTVGSACSEYPRKGLGVAGANLRLDRCIGHYRPYLLSLGAMV